MSVKDVTRRNLQYYLDNTGKSQTELAGVLGVTRGAVSAWVRGKASIDIEYIPTICRFLGIEIADLFGASFDYDVKAISQLYASLDNDEKKQVRDFIQFLRWKR